MAKTLTESDLARTLAVCDAQEAVMVLAGHRAGLRALEVAGLTWDMVTDTSGNLADHIDLPALNSKGKRGGARLPMADDLLAALRRLWRMRRFPTSGPVILSPRCERVKAHAVVKRLRRVYERAGLHGATSHSGRRTFATRLLEEKRLSLPSVQMAMRHAKASTTLGYVDPAGDDTIAEAMRGLGQ